MLLSEIKQTKYDAFYFLEVTLDTSALAMFKDMVDDEGTAALLDKRFGGIKPLTPEIANDIKKKAEDILNVKLHGPGLVDPHKIVFSMDKGRLEQRNGQWWNVDEKLHGLAPKGYQILTSFFDDDFFDNDK